MTKPARNVQEHRVWCQCVALALAVCLEVGLPWSHGV